MKEKLSDNFMPERQFIPPNKKSWSVEWPEYDPPFFESDDLLTAEYAVNPPQDFWQESFPSAHGSISRDKQGRPLNPNGRTGLFGRGVLGRYGANYTADPIIINPNSNSVLLVVRHNGKLAIPGGFVDNGESSIMAAKRELCEETGIKPSSELSEIFSGVVEKSERATDNAWIETTVFLGYGEGIPVVSFESLEAKWVPIDHALKQGLFDDHKKYLQIALNNLIKIL